MPIIRGVDPHELFESRAWSALKKAIMRDLVFARTKLETTNPARVGQMGRYQGQIEALTKLLTLPEHYEDTTNEEDNSAKTD